MMYYKLIKDGRTWDCFPHQSDTIKYQDKIAREEPDAVTAVVSITEAEFREWKELLNG